MEALNYARKKYNAEPSIILIPIPDPAEATMTPDSVQNIPVYTTSDRGMINKILIYFQDVDTAQQLHDILLIEP